MPIARGAPLRIKMAANFGRETQRVAERDATSRPKICERISMSRDRVILVKRTRCRINAKPMYHNFPELFDSAVRVLLRAFEPSASYIRTEKATRI